jgi:hypothetical protein
MKHLKRSCIVALALGVASAHAEEPPPTVYVGQLAGKSIVLTFSQLDGFDSDNKAEVKARYFYRHIGTIIPIVRQEDGSLQECVERFNWVECDKPTGIWSIPVPEDARMGPETITAQWRNKAQATPTSITLKKFSSNKQPSDAWTTLLGTGPTHYAGVTQLNGLRAAFLTDKRSGAKVLQLLSGFSADIQDRFNAARRAELITLAARRLENHSLDGGEEESKKVVFLSPNVVAFAGNSGGYYGGAHGLYGYGSTTYQVTTNKIVDFRTEYFRHITLEDVRKFKKKRDTSFYSVSIPRTYLRRQRVVENLVLTELEKQPRSQMPYSKKMATGDESYEDCFEQWRRSSLYSDGADNPGTLNISDWGEETRIAAFDLMPMQSGLGVYTNDFAEAGRGCRSLMMVIPWKKVEPYLTQPLGINM